MSGPVAIRELPPEEYGRLQAAGGPLSHLTLAPSDDARVVVGERDGRIVAYWVAHTVVHLEPLWIDPAHRHRPSLIGGLLREMRALLARLRVPFAWAIIADADLPVNLPMAEKIGFVKVPGGLYGIQLGPPRGESDAHT